MESNKKFIVIDRDEDSRGSYETKGEAVHRAIEVINQAKHHGPCVVYMAVSHVKTASEPVQVIDV